MSFDYETYAGDTLEVSIYVPDAESDLIGASFTYTISPSVPEASLVTKTGTITVANTVVVPLSDADTAAVGPGSFYHECTVVDTSGNVSTVKAGLIKFNRKHNV